MRVTAVSRLSLSAEAPAGRAIFAAATRAQIVYFAFYDWHADITPIVMHFASIHQRHA